MCGGPKRRAPSASAAPMPRPAPVTAAAAKAAAAGVNKGTYRKAVFRKEHRLFAASGWVDKLGFVELLGFAAAPCLSLWERCPSAHTGAERAITHPQSRRKTPSQSKIGSREPIFASSPRGRAKSAYGAKQLDKLKFEPSVVWGEAMGGADFLGVKNCTKLFGKEGNVCLLLRLKLPLRGGRIRGFQLI